MESHREELEGKKIAMFCTGGIRCEKATAYVKGLGFDDVFHLKGGILKYLEDVPAEESRWEGECFVFDERVSVGHGLVEGEAELCHACRNPIATEDKLSPLFEEGVSCRIAITSARMKTVPVSPNGRSRCAWPKSVARIVTSVPERLTNSSSSLQCHEPGPN